jgi:hypothetical protein
MADILLFLSKLVGAKKKSTRFLSRQDRTASQAGDLSTDLVRLGLCHRKQDRYRSGVRTRSVDIRPLNHRASDGIDCRRLNENLMAISKRHSISVGQRMHRRSRFSEVFVENERFCCLVGR